MQSVRNLNIHCYHVLKLLIRSNFAGSIPLQPCFLYHCWLGGFGAQFVFLYSRESVATDIVPANNLLIASRSTNGIP